MATSKVDPLDPLLIDGGDDPATIDDKIKDLARQVAELIGVEHHLGLQGARGVGYNEPEAGEHKLVTLREQSSPIVAEDTGIVFAKVISGVAELFYINENEVEVQLTSGGKVKKASIQDGVTSDNSTSLSSKSWFLDQDNMSGNDATKVASQRSIKTFVTNAVRDIKAPQTRAANTAYNEGESGFAYVEYEFTWDNGVDQYVTISSSSSGGVATEVSRMGCHCVRGDSENNQVLQSMTIPIPAGYGCKIADVGANVVFKRATWYPLMA